MGADRADSASPAGDAERGAGRDHVVVLHGLGRTRRSMAKLALRLAARGYAVENVSYPSRQAPIERLATGVVGPLIEQRLAEVGETERPVHFVTHSLGGILTRFYLRASGAERSGRLPTGHPLGRVVMLAPPNQGSEVADWLQQTRLPRALFGPAICQLGTDPDSVPSALNKGGGVPYQVGVIAGDRSINPILSTRIPGPNDGKVSLERTRLEGMTDFIVVPRTHTFIMVAEEVIEQVAHFLERGRFSHREAPQEPRSEGTMDTT